MGCFLQDFQMLSQALLEDFAQIFEQMPTVQHLVGLRSPFVGSFEIAGSPISTDDLDSWMSQEPVCQHLLVAAQQHLHRLVALQVHEQRSCSASSKRPVIYTQDPRRWARGRSASTQQGEQRGCTHGHPMGEALTSPCFPAQGPPNG